MIMREVWSVAANICGWEWVKLDYAWAFVLAGCTIMRACAVWQGKKSETTNIPTSSALVEFCNSAIRLWDEMMADKKMQCTLESILGIPFPYKSHADGSCMYAGWMRVGWDGWHEDTMYVGINTGYQKYPFFIEQVTLPPACCGLAMTPSLDAMPF